MQIAHLQPTYLADLADLCGQAGFIDEGLSCVDKALKYAKETGARRNEAELYRLQGELLQRVVDETRQTANTPEMSFLKALEIARRQQAKSLELRVAISLCRLWLQQDKQNEARELLSRACRVIGRMLSN
ncbi:hypothetical protein C2W62_30315 [Candidatus Entotheonella serta]|nr:hypothetical protein C2W62_30315 [Candidatus Entotheonella serta]